MKFKKKLWISLILFILFGTVFSGWIFHQNTTREYLVFDNTTQLVTTEHSSGFFSESTIHFVQDNPYPG